MTEDFRRPPLGLVRRGLRRAARRIFTWTAVFTSTANIPKSSAQLWVGNWPAFYRDSSTMQHLYVDCKITELGKGADGQDTETRLQD
jgi:hypothetical protein